MTEQEFADVPLIPRSMRGVGWRCKEEKTKINGQLSANVATWREMGKPYPLPFHITILAMAAEELDTFLTSKKGQEAISRLGDYRIRLVFRDYSGDPRLGEYGRYHTVDYLGGEGLRSSHESYKELAQKAKSEELKPTRVSVLDSKMAILAARSMAMDELDVVPVLESRLLDDWEKVKETAYYMRNPRYGYLTWLL